MKLLIEGLVGWVVACSILSFVLCGWDKRAARAQRRRIPEKRFFTLAALGGGPGLWMGMLTFRHKTRHMSFLIVAPLTSIVWVGALIWLAIRVLWFG